MVIYMKLKHIHPYVRFCDKVSHEKNFAYCSLAQDCRLFYAIEGTHTLVTSNATYDICGGDIVYIPHSLPYKSTYSPVFSQIKINFDFFDAAKEFPPKPLPILFINHLDANTEPFQKPLAPPFDDVILMRGASNCRQYFEDIFRQMQTQKNEFDVIAASLLTSILAQMQQNSLLGSEKTNLLVDTIIHYIHKNYMTPLTAKQISDELHFHPVYINRQFKLATSCSIYQYILNYRCNEAKRLLDTTDLSIQNIAFEVGFQSAAHFTQIFKKRTGKSPLDYRKEKYVLL